MTVKLDFIRYLTSASYLGCHETDNRHCIIITPVKAQSLLSPSYYKHPHNTHKPAIPPPKETHVRETCH